MRNLIIAVIISVLLVSGFIFFKQDKKLQRQTEKKATVQSAETEDESPVETYIFVPYWTIDADLVSAQFDNFVYFGITAGSNGINYEDQGYKVLTNFTKTVHGKKTYLTLRMLDSEVNLKVLKDKQLQDKIISESVEIAQLNHFSGIILDLEMPGLPFDSLVNSITAFNSLFADKSHVKKLSFGTLIYGDAFYRVRPFDVENISKKVDRVFVMAYDFSKSKGDPGPNFPLSGLQKYGYDFETMVSDFLKVIPKEKVTVIFGMFGYDWQIDESGRGKSLATSKSTLQFEKFMTRCVDENSCTVDNSEVSSGTKITYKENDENHIIWFENYKSVEGKNKYLLSKDLHSIAYWAYSFY